MSNLLSITLQVNNSNEANITSYYVTDELKDKYTYSNAININAVKMKIKEIEMSNIQDPFKLMYNRYLSYNGENNNTNLREISVNKKDNATMKNTKNIKSFFLFEKKLLGYFKLNFVEMSYGNSFDYDKNKSYDIPIEFFHSKDVLINNYKFYIIYDKFQSYKNEKIIIHLSES